ncbi:MAG: hypothetical protein H6819_06415 [Phycisphaerales bacterium]|nr:hypothetical protein [Phycisphaerales bacterium]MCB9858545.1 hypothetical protein [Phycisphaerales bacterium]
MRYEFHWDLPTPTGPADLRLQISSISGWLGTKSLTLDGNPVYRRGIFAGINQRLDIPGAPGRGHFTLKAARTGPDNEWRPTLYAGNDIIPEKLGTKPPHNPRRPTSLAATVGITYLLILTALIMWTSIENMLFAGFTNADSKEFVLVVEGPESKNAIHALHPCVLSAPLGESFREDLSAPELKPPLAWHRVSGRFPDGLSLRSDGRLEGTASEAGDFPFTLRVVDARGKHQYAGVVRIEAIDEPSPKITIDSLPTARVGEPYTATMNATGGKPPLTWICNSRKLPNGLKFKKIEPINADSNQEEPATTAPSRTGDRDAIWQITGTPEMDEGKNGEPPAPIGGAYPIQFRVHDSEYDPSSDTRPWIVPICVTALMMLGFWSMRRMAVLAFAIAIGVELLFAATGWERISMIAIGIQGFILMIGVINLRHMR